MYFAPNVLNFLVAVRQKSRKKDKQERKLWEIFRYLSI